MALFDTDHGEMSVRDCEMALLDALDDLNLTPPPMQSWASDDEACLHVPIDKLCALGKARADLVRALGRETDQEEPEASKTQSLPPLNIQNLDDQIRFWDEERFTARDDQGRLFAQISYYALQLVRINHGLAWLDTKIAVRAD